MITVQYLEARNVLCVSGIAAPFPAGSLVALRQGAQLAVASPHDGTLVCGWADFSLWTMPNPAGGDPLAFASADDAFAYLDATCTQQPALPQAALTASGAVGGQRAVVAAGADQVVHASADTPDHCGSVLGLSAGAAADGAAVIVVQAGPMVDPSWTWTPGPIWLGLDGALTQDPPELPAAAFRQKLADATGPTRIVVGLAHPILLA
ncbi:hypothetical protein MKK75_27105 [Methylobacterium sp. J-030]|uniref:hypothetical protein n=1 Tax=Methylobacterium sp. J-030 TaxID=2836627 RepID=UPI001FB8A4F2|nr:hypothetical protein [Methylobacterium sp. J-030]MCJ2072417.1 hypothetical protein [Methylobacterium sp. J-030]